MLQTLFSSRISWFFPALGVGLIGFSAQILWTLRQGGPKAIVLWYFTTSDLLWVVASALLVGIGVVRAEIGVALVMGAAAVVLVFALLQLRFRAGAKE